VMNLLAPPPSLMHPRIMWRVLRGGRKAAKAHTAEAVNDPPADGREQLAVSS
jgi:hypothetical protein